MFTSCWHVGNPACHVEGIENMMRRVNKVKMPWIHMGDLCECVLPTDRRRFNPQEHKDMILDQIESAVNLMNRGSKYLWAMITGNHEGRASQLVGVPMKSAAGAGGVVTVI